ncbi:MAG: alpha-amylase, partial [Bacteroidaceae bacterium]|nr:alpha-amylase [Bacteroidaceae bacterium]
MKKIYTILWMLTISVATMAQGWPEKYEGVMLQGFYWDGYADAQWTNLESQADELSQFFSLIWVPNSGKTSSFYHNSSSKTMGYDPCFWLDHNTCFGTEAQLRSMINTFKAKGTGIIEDVVINHKNG